MRKWQTLSSEEVYKTPWIKVRRDEVLNQDGKPLTYSIVELHHPSVFIVATNAKGEILIQQAYRYTIDKIIWEIPAGGSDGDNLLAAAKRELLEETGLESDDWQELGSMYQAPGIGNIPLVAFWARNVRNSPTHADDDGDIRGQKFMSLAEIEDMVRSRGFDNVPALAILYLAKLYGLK